MHANPASYLDIASAAAPAIVGSLDPTRWDALLKHASYVFLDMFYMLLRDEGFDHAAETLAHLDYSDVHAAVRVLAGEYELGDGDVSEDMHHAVGISIVEREPHIAKSERIHVVADALCSMLYTEAEGIERQYVEEEVRWILHGWATLVTTCGKSACCGYRGTMASELLAAVQEVTNVYVEAPDYYDDVPPSDWDFYKAMTKEECKALAAHDAQFEESEPTVDKINTRRGSLEERLVKPCKKS